MSDFGTVLITDSRIADLTSELAYSVQMGGAQNTAQSFSPTSATNSSIVTQIQIPSENIIVDRHIVVRSTINLTISIGNATTGGQVPPGQLAFNLGVTDALQSFPFNRLISTSQATINNCSVSSNTQDILDGLLRFNNSDELYRYNSTTPALVDQAYANYSDGVNANNNPLGNYGDASYDLNQIPRGAFPVTVNSVVHYITAGGTDNSLTSTNVNDYWVIQVQTSVREPLLCLSPFIWSDPAYNSQGLVGINNMSFNFSLDSTCKRVWSTAYDYAGPYSVSLGWAGVNGGNAFTDIFFDLILLSSQSSQLIASKNVCPYFDYPRYLTNAGGTPLCQPGVQTEITSNTIQISQIPDYFVIYARIPMTQQTPQNTCSFFTINGVSCNFNNASGLLSSYTSAQLWEASIAAGSNQSFTEWSGKALQNNVDGKGTVVGTTGSLLVINPSMLLSLPNYLSCGSLGNFQFQIRLNVTNNYASAVSPEIVIITANSGIFVTQQGQSSTFTGILTKEMVLSTAGGKNVPEISKVEYERQVGGKILNRGLAMQIKHFKRIATKPMLYGGGDGASSNLSGGVMSMGLSGAGIKRTKLSNLIK
jgi:hypothetical protein